MKVQFSLYQESFVNLLTEVGYNESYVKTLIFVDCSRWNLDIRNFVDYGR